MTLFTKRCHCNWAAVELGWEGLVLSLIPAIDQYQEIQVQLGGRGTRLERRRLGMAWAWPFRGMGYEEIADGLKDGGYVIRGLG